MIAVTEANGYSRQLVIEGPVERVPAHQVIVAVFNREKPSSFGALDFQLCEAVHPPGTKASIYLSAVSIVMETKAERNRSVRSTAS